LTTPRTLYESAGLGEWIEVNGGLPGNVITIINPGSQTSQQGSTVSLQIAATDSGTGQTLIYTATGLPAGLSLNSATGLITGTPTAIQATMVSLRVSDLSGASSITAFAWAVTTGSTTGNTVTVTNPGAQSSISGNAVTLPVAAIDSATGQTLTYGATGLPTGLSINPATGLITGTPTTTQSLSVQVTATDTTGASGAAAFAWAVTTGSSGYAGLVGATTNPKTYSLLLPQAYAAAQIIDGYVGAPLSLEVQRVYLQEGAWTFFTPNDQGAIVQALAPYGCKFQVCVKPSRVLTSGEQTNLANFLASMAAVTTNFDVTLWTEMNIGTNFPSPGGVTYPEYWNYYAPVILASPYVTGDLIFNPGTYPPVYGTAVGYAQALNPYPAAVTADMYGNDWKAGASLHQAPSGVSMSFAQFADSIGAKAGYSEIGSWTGAAGVNGPLSDADFSTMLTEEITYFRGRIAARKKNADFIPFTTYLGSTAGTANYTWNYIQSAADPKTGNISPYTGYLQLHQELSAAAGN
jgi:hypothetical protein